MTTNTLKSQPIMRPMGVVPVDKRTFNHPNNEPIGLNAYRLEEEYSVSVMHPTLKQTMFITVPAGFEYDGATVPFGSTLFGISRDGQNRAGALLHDYIYHKKGLVDGIFYSRKDADLIFFELLLRGGVPTKTALLQYRYVRALAWVKWYAKPKI